VLLACQRNIKINSQNKVEIVDVGITSLAFLLLVSRFWPAEFYWCCPSLVLSKAQQCYHFNNIMPLLHVQRARVLSASFVSAFLKNGGGGGSGWREVNVTPSAHALLSTAAQNKIKIHCMAVWAACTYNNEANTAAHCVIWLVNTCLAVPLHKPSRDEPSQIGMQTPSKLTRTINWVAYLFIVYFLSFIGADNKRSIWRSIEVGLLQNYYLISSRRIVVLFVTN
jgi:hypothetical protein